MSKTTSTTTYYTSDVNVNGTANVSSLLANNVVVRRIKVNDTDVIHKFTRTVVTANSNLTFTITFRFSYQTSTLCGFTDYDFSSPIYLDITVTNTAGTSSGFTSITGVQVFTQFYCQQGNHQNSYNNERWYENSLYNQSFTLGQQKTLTFSYYNGKGIEYEKESFSQATRFHLEFSFTDPDGVAKVAPTITKDVSLSIQGGTYSTSLSGTRVVSNQVLSDTTVQEY